MNTIAGLRVPLLSIFSKNVQTSSWIPTQMAFSGFRWCIAENEWFFCERKHKTSTRNISIHEHFKFEGDLNRSSSRRTDRKRRSLTAGYDYRHASNSNPYIVSVALGESFELVDMISDERLTALYIATCVNEESDEGLHFIQKKEYLTNQKDIREFFVFEDGVVVFWGFEDSERESILHLLSRHTNEPYKSELVNEETDSLPFSIVNGGRSHVSKNLFCLDVSKYNGDFKATSSILERYAFSHGMAASVKIGIWESQLSDQAEPLASITEELAKGNIPWKRKEALRKTGQFAKLRHSINLNCDLLDSDFYWERENLETFYYMAFHHFSVPKRIKLLNSRLDYCGELVGIVDRILCDRHASMLEWMVIVLIVIEVFFDIWHFSLSLEERSSNLKRDGDG